MSVPASSTASLRLSTKGGKLAIMWDKTMATVAFSPM